MAVYEIVKNENPVLREVAKPIQHVDEVALRLLANLRDTLNNTETGVGLAAPQIGISKRAIVVDDGETHLEMINPEIVEYSKETIDDWEGCLSVPGETGLVERAYKVKARYYDEKGRHLEIEAEDFLARIIQHEVDHLNGILFIDKAKRIKKD